jgi:hypothetical protein
MILTFFNCSQRKQSKQLLNKTFIETVNKSTKIYYILKY